MNKKNILKTLGLVVLLAMAASCKDKDLDKQAPVIKVEEPENGDTLSVGHPIHFEVNFSDNEHLASYKVDIHNNFNGHHHHHKAEKEPFFFQKTWSLNGQRSAHVHHHEIAVPEDAHPGNYHFMVYCVDEAGNESFVTRDIVLSTDTSHVHHHEH